MGTGIGTRRRGSNMNHICRDIFKAIHEGKWLSIEYRNQSGQVTKYWIGIYDLDVRRGSLSVEGLHLGQYTTCRLDCIFIESILSSRVIDGSYFAVNGRLVRDISLHPDKYKILFAHTANLKILNYLEACNRMDATPYKRDFSLIRYLDRDRLEAGTYALNDEQFQSIVKQFQYRAEEEREKGGRLQLQQLAMNVLSIHTPRGLYVMAYRKLLLDVAGRFLRPEEDITVCTEFTVEGQRESIRRYLDADEYEMLDRFEENQERIKDCVARRVRRASDVDDMPYVIGIGMDLALDLHGEYAAVIEMYEKQEAAVPIRAFFGDLLGRPVRRKNYPIALADKRINLDQLLAIHNAMKYPVAYIQGPPGTGKTSTIINTIVTAFFNDRTVLFSSYNNHPIDGVFRKLSDMKYQGRVIPFPILRLGNNDYRARALRYMKKLREATRQVSVFDSTLDKNKGDRVQRAGKLSDLLKRYEEVLDLKERSETIGRLLEYHGGLTSAAQLFPFQADLQGRQLRQVNERIAGAGEISDADALALLTDDTEELLKYLYYTSARYIKRLENPENEQLRAILETEDEEEQAAAFGKYLARTENVRKLQKIFPVILTTCISAHQLGEPEQMFDMVVIDEASQCNTAVSLVPVLRGRNLMLVGDPQQLRPVILLDPNLNEKLKKKYGISEEYDYCANSIYKTFLACDSVSDETLLRYHYRCRKEIIEFNNRKYYNSRLQICTQDIQDAQSIPDTQSIRGTQGPPLVYLDVPQDVAAEKNTSPAEVDAAVRYALRHATEKIGVITPFVNQKNALEKALTEAGLHNVTCGTVHAFQGDEKDIILFSTAITDQTGRGTYDWLKNNRELINVATSRARRQLVVLSSGKDLERLHRREDSDDDLYELVQYVKSNGKSVVTPKTAISRALGVKPFSTETENAFLQNLSHALENIWLSQNRFVIHREVPISQVFAENTGCSDLFYSGRFDFVVYERRGREEYPVLAIELDGKEHYEDAAVQIRDRKKNKICREHNLELIRVENSYARRYNHIKEILIEYFKIRH